MYLGRFLGIDFGSKTTGIALSDPTGTIVSPVETIVREKEGKIRPTLRRIIELIAENKVELVVIGLPLNMDDTRGERAFKSEEFAEILKNRIYNEGFYVPIVMWDERLSTVEADGILEEALVARQERKKYIDKIAAALILEDYIKNGMKEQDGE